MHLNFIAQISIASVLIIAFSSTTFADEFSTAKSLYSKGQFAQAKDTLLRQLAQSPGDASAHYLLGNTYLELKDFTNAETHYAIAVKLEPHSEAGKYSLEALSLLSKSGSSAQPSTPGYLNAAPPVSVQPYSQSDTKNSQAASSALTSVNGRYSLECDGRINDILSNKEAKIRGLEQHRDQQIQENNSQRFHNRYASYNPAADNAIVTRNFSEAKKQVDDDAEKQCEEVRTFYRSKEEAMQDASALLQNPNSSRGSGIRLAPGTNIFNRNYQSFSDTSGSQIPIKAAPAKLLQQPNVTR